MSWQATSWAAKVPIVKGPRRDPAVMRGVLTQYADRADSDGRGAWVHTGEVADLLARSTRAIEYAIRGLREQGLITEGDQSLVSHIRADKRPTVWNLSTPARTVGQRPELRFGATRSATRTSVRGANLSTERPEPQCASDPNLSSDITTYEQSLNRARPRQTLDVYDCDPEARALRAVGTESHRRAKMDEIRQALGKKASGQ